MANLQINISFGVFVCLCQGISLHLAARQGDLDTVKHLVDEGDDINSKDKNGVRMTIVTRIY